MTTGALPAPPDGSTPAQSLISTTHLIYGLHTLSVLIGITSAATIIGAFVFGVPSILAVIINYVRRSEVRGTFLDSHFRWQIRTFWYAALWVVAGWLLFVTLIGIPLAFLLWGFDTAWVIYRIARGWIALRDLRPMYT